MNSSCFSQESPSSESEAGTSIYMLSDWRAPRVVASLQTPEACSQRGPPELGSQRTSLWTALAWNPDFLQDAITFPL